MKRARNLLLLRRPSALRGSSSPLVRSCSAAEAKPLPLHQESLMGGAAAAVMTTTRLTSPSTIGGGGGPTLEPKREFAVELARSTLNLGKLAQHRDMSPLSLLVNNVTVEQMLSHKKGDEATVYEVREDEPVIKAIELMCEKRIGSVAVRGYETQLHVGMMSRIDCMRNLVLKNQFARETPVYKVMDKSITCVTPSFSLRQCLELMAQGPDMRYLPVVSDIGDWTDTDTRVTGVLGQRDLLNWFVRCFLDAIDADSLDDDRATAGDMFDREEVGRESGAIYVNSDATVFDALTCMAQTNQTYVVVNKGQQMVGIFTGTDYLNKIILPGRKSKHTNIMEVATKNNIVVAAPHYTLIDCISLMLQNEIQHLPIGEWRQMLPSENEDQNNGESVTAFETDRYANSQPLGVITAYDCIDYLDNQPKMKV